MANKVLQQAMPGGLPLQVLRLAELRSEASFVRHRHDFCMLWWVTAGKGSHRVNFAEQELSAGMVCFMPDGAEHQVLAYPEDGWLVLFSPAMLRALRLGIADGFCVRMTDRLSALYAGILPLLSQIGPCATCSLCTLLCHTRELAMPALSRDDAGVMSKLRELVNVHFAKREAAPFYAGRIGVQERKLNGICKKATGMLVQEYAAQRLLSECVLMLAEGMDIKLIISELGFSDHAHFSMFFKKHKGITPTEFRSRL